MDKRYIRCKGQHRPKASTKQIKKFCFQKGESGRERANKQAVEKENGEIEWVVPPENEGKPIGMDLFRGKQYLHLPDKNIDSPKRPGRKKKDYPNLRPWQPGESGNPSGRPVGSISIIERLKVYLRRHPEDVDKIAEELVNLSKTKSWNQLPAIKEVMDRIDGKVAEKHKIEGEMPIKIIFVPAQQVLGTEEPKQLEEAEEQI